MLAGKERLRRAAAAAFRYRNALMWTLYAGGIVAFLLLPLLSSSGYVDEKALLIGVIPATWKSAVPATAISAHRVATAGVHMSLAPLVVAAEEAAARAVTALQAWQAVTGGGGCEAVYRVVPAGRGDGTEALALVLPVDLGDAMSAALAASVGVTAAKQLAEAAWLAKDVAVAFVDSSRCSALESTQAWLHALESSNISFSLPQLGQVQQALVLDVSSASATEARLGVHGYGGQLPNMDMVFLVKRNLDYFTGLPVGLDVGWAPASHAQHAPIGAVALAGQAATAAAFAARLASGQPSGAHAAFLQRGIDALSITLRRPAAAGDRMQQRWSGPAARDTSHFALTAAEMVIHTCNNLQEKLHHSNTLYVLVSPDRFVSVGAYLTPPVCLLLAALLQAAGRLEAARGSLLQQWQAAWVQAIVLHGGIVLVLLGWQQHGAAGATSLPGSAFKAAVTMAAAAAGVFSFVRWGRAWAAGTAEEQQPNGSEKAAAAGCDGELVGVQTPRAAMIVCLVVVEASALLLFKWAASFLLLLIAVPVAQLLPGAR